MTPLEQANKAIARKLLTSIDDLEISVRIHSILRMRGIFTIADLVRKEESDFKRHCSSTPKFMADINELIYSMDLHWGMDVDAYISAKVKDEDLWNYLWKVATKKAAKIT
ncbi:MAG: hypothetical protein FWC26_10335 [Fibromonadales bacterium]|nr:hypothetical protein [Fibromonadales bacterium]